MFWSSHIWQPKHAEQSSIVFLGLLNASVKLRACQNPWRRRCVLLPEPEDCVCVWKIVFRAEVYTDAEPFGAKIATEYSELALNLNTTEVVARRWSSKNPATSPTLLAAHPVVPRNLSWAVRHSIIRFLPPPLL